MSFDPRDADGRAAKQTLPAAVTLRNDKINDAQVNWWKDIIDYKQ